MGLLTDRLNGRTVYTALLIFSAIPALLIPSVFSYAQLLEVAFCLGMAGSSFAVAQEPSLNRARRTSGVRWPCAGWSEQGQNIDNRVTVPAVSRALNAAKGFAWTLTEPQLPSASESRAACSPSPDV